MIILLELILLVVIFICGRYLLKQYNLKKRPWKIEDKAIDIIGKADLNQYNVAFANFYKKKRYFKTVKKFNEIIAYEIYLINKENEVKEK